MDTYQTIVIDPPWEYKSWPTSMSAGAKMLPKGAAVDNLRRTDIPYPCLSVAEIMALPVKNLADPAGCHLYLWTTNKYLPAAFGVLDAWGFRYSQTLVWAKTPMGLGPGGTFAQSAEFILFARRGTLRHKQRATSVWWNWKRTGKHSKKPEAFQDVVESISPGPYLELFGRRRRPGWTVLGSEVGSGDLRCLA